MDETATVTHSVTSGDNSYNGAPAPSITVNVTDDDNRQVTVSYEPAMYTVAEGDMVTVTVTLNADPERTVVIPLTATPQGTATSADYSGVPASRRRRQELSLPDSARDRCPRRSPSRTTDADVSRPC